MPAEVYVDTTTSVPMTLDVDDCRLNYKNSNISTLLEPIKTPIYYLPVVIFSASSSGISKSKFSSKAMTSSTVSKLSAPRSSMKLFSTVTCRN